MSADDMSKLQKQIDLLKGELNHLQNEFSKNFQYMSDQLNNKADRHELLELEARLMDKLNEIIKNLLN